MKKIALIFGFALILDGIYKGYGYLDKGIFKAKELIKQKMK